MRQRNTQAHRGTGPGAGPRAVATAVRVGGGHR
jgi:hypothetical protein